jgi:hypothetical protein
MTDPAIENAWQERRKWLYSKRWENRKRAKRADSGTSTPAGTTSTADATMQDSPMWQIASDYVKAATHTPTLLALSPSYNGTPICQNCGHGANARTGLCNDCYVRSL